MTPRTVVASIVTFALGAAAGAWRELRARRRPQPEQRGRTDPRGSSWAACERMADEAGWRIVGNNGSARFVRR